LKGLSAEIKISRILKEKLSQTKYIFRYFYVSVFVIGYEVPSEISGKY